MSASATPYGVRPIGSLSASGSWAATIRHVPIANAYNTAIFFGDFVKGVAAGGVELDTGTTTLTPCGIFLGCFYTEPTTKVPTFNKQWPASLAATDAVAYVLDDPHVVFTMQGDATLAATARLANVGVVQTAGDTDIGMSKNAIDSSDEATTNTLPLKILGFTDGPLDSVGDSFTDAICMFNVGHQYLNTTGV
jgi:hypothetical protein